MVSTTTIGGKKDEGPSVPAGLPAEIRQFRSAPGRSHRATRVLSGWRLALFDSFLIFLITFGVHALWTAAGPWLREWHFAASFSSTPWNGELAFLVPYAISIVLLLQAEGIYKARRVLSRRDATLLVFCAVALSTLLLVSVSYSLVSQLPAWGELCMAGSLNIVALSGGRAPKRGGWVRRSGREDHFRNTLIVGADDNGQVLADYLDRNPHLGYLVKGFVDPDSHTNPRLLGKLDDLRSIVGRYFIEEVFVPASSEKRDLDGILDEARRQRFAVKLFPQVFAGAATSRDGSYIGDFAVRVLQEEPGPPFQLVLKRALDIVLGCLGLVLALPIMTLAALIIKLDSPGPVIYRSWRVGKNGKHFLCYKFRTMVDNAHELKEQLLHLNERHGPLFKISEDPRLTRTGGILRKYSIDELPQLWNVLQGDMTLVGPRPALPEELGEYRSEHMRRLAVSPGLTGLWQVTARNDPSFLTYMALDLYYANNWSLRLDFWILCRTIPAVWRAEGR